MKNMALVLLAVAVLAGVGIWFTVGQDDEPANNTASTSQETAADTLPVNSSANETSTPSTLEQPEIELTMGEVASHSTEDDCWTVIDGVVYDLTDFIQSGEHPGGDDVVAACGIDGTDLFTGQAAGGRQHSPLASSLLEDYELGPLAN